MKNERRKEDQLIFKVIEYGIAEDKTGNPIVQGKMDAELQISDLDQNYLYEQLAFNYAGSIRPIQPVYLIDSKKSIGPNHIMTRANTGGSGNTEYFQQQSTALRLS